MPQNTKPEPTNVATEPQLVEKLYMENTLLRVSGALFCHDAKRASSRKEKIELNRGLKESRIVIEPHPSYGQPGPLAHKIFIAILKKHSDYGRPHPNEASFTKREIMRLIGRKEWGGRDSQQLTQALAEIQRTFITAHFKKGNLWCEDIFNIFPRVLLERKEDQATAVIESCTVTLADPIIASLREDHFSCYNYFFLQRLGTIGQAIYLRTFFHFANLYEQQRGKKGLMLQKRYDDICAEWLGGLTVHSKKSLIEREQLGCHLVQLVGAEFLSSYAIERAKSREGFVVTFRPGAGFFRDYENFYRHRNQGELQWDFHTDRREIAEPLKLAHLFLVKSTGQPAHAVPFVSTGETQNAKDILEHVPFEEADDFIDFALTQAKKTKFDVKSLGGIKQYVTSYLATRQHTRAHRAAEAARRACEAEEAARVAYDRARRQAIKDLFGQLPQAEQDTIMALARGRAATSGFGRNSPTMIELSRWQITSDRHTVPFPSFEEWKARKN